MRAFVATSLNGPDSLKVQEVPSPPPPGPGQVRITMRAASVNYRDLLVLSGQVRSANASPLIPCSDGAGEVSEVGADVWRVKVGDRVALTFNPDWIAGPWRPTPGSAGRGGAISGVMQGEVVVNQHEVVLLPKHLSFEEGATLPCAAVTAWHALCDAKPLLPGMTVLLEGGGGVSMFALQFAKLFGARVIVTSSNAERCARLRGYGADETVDYRVTPEWSSQVLALTGGRGVDLTIEVGGARTVQQALAATRAGGRLALVGLLTGRADASLLAAQGKEITPIMVGSREDFEAMNRAIEFHRLRPVIDRCFRFDELPNALRYLQTGYHMGKVVITFE